MFHEKEDNVEAGLDLNTEQKWSLLATTLAAANNWMVCAVTQRMLHIEPGLIELD